MENKRIAVVIQKMKRNHNGFTMIEMLIAVVIFAIAALALGQYQIALSKKRVINQRYTKALYYAEEKMEELRRKGYTNVFESSEPFATGVHGDTNFSRTVTVVPGAKIRTVTVTVSWKDPGGNVHNPAVEIKSIFAK